MDGSLEFVFNDLDLNFYPELTHDDVTTLSTLHSELNYVQKDYDTGSDVTTEMNDVWTLNFSEWCQTLAESGRREAGGLVLACLPWALGAYVLTGRVLRGTKSAG